MSTLKLFGFSAHERQALQRAVPAAHWEEGEREALATPRPEEEIWVVHVTAATAFLHAPVSPPPAVLWVPQDHEPLALDDWWESFHAQLREASAADRAWLARLSRCAHVLAWSERVEDLPAAWFAALPGSPRRETVDVLPFEAAAKQHLRQCDACREEVYELLQQRAERRWAFVCPTVDAIAAWLEVDDKDPRLEAHITGCRLCQETVQRQAWLWAGADLLPAARLHAKFAAVDMGVWLASAVTWQPTPAPTGEAWATLLIAMLCRFTALRPARRSARGAAQEADVPLEALTAELAAGRPITLSDREHWLHLTVSTEPPPAVLLRAGQTPATRFTEFRVELRRGTDVIVAAVAERGVVQLALDHFLAAQHAHADRLVIIK